MATFTDAQRGSFRFHMGVPDSEQHAALIGAVRSVIGSSYMVDKGLALLNDASAPRALNLLAQMDDKLNKLQRLTDSVEFESAGTVKRNPLAREELVASYDDSGRLLASLIGCSPAYVPFSDRGGGGGSSINSTWSR